MTEAIIGGLIGGAITLLVGICGGIYALGKNFGVLDEIKNDLNNSIKPDIKELSKKFAVVEDRLETIWKDRLAPASSPRQLNDRGKEVLEKSGIKKIVDDNKALLLEQVKKKGAKNAYDAEQDITMIMLELPKHCPKEIEKLKVGAFLVGADIDSILFAGSIYLRNLIFPELGYSLDDLDKPRK